MGVTPSMKHRRAEVLEVSLVSCLPSRTANRTCSLCLLHLQSLRIPAGGDCRSLPSEAFADYGDGELLECRTRGTAQLGGETLNKTVE